MPLEKSSLDYTPTIDKSYNIQISENTYTLNLTILLLKKKILF